MQYPVATGDGSATLFFCAYYSHCFNGQTLRNRANGSGVFTTLFVDVLGGAAGNLGNATGLPD
jgi:hypothetical protein